MSWVQSLQSKLDEVQSSIDARLEKKKKDEGANKEEEVPTSSETTRHRLGALGDSAEVERRPVLAEEDEDEEAWPSLGATRPVTSAPIEPEEEEIGGASSGYAEVDAIARARRLVRSCARLLDDARAGADELELRVADAGDARAARTAGRKEVTAKIRGYRETNVDVEEVLESARVELEACGRRGRDADAALVRAVEACGRPAGRARAKLARVEDALETAEAAATRARRDDAETSELQHRSMREVALMERSKASATAWRLARAALRAETAARRRPGRRSSESATTPRAALLAFRLDAFEKHRVAMDETRKALKVATTSRDCATKLALAPTAAAAAPPTEDAVERVLGGIKEYARAIEAASRQQPAAASEKLASECERLRKRAEAAEADGAVLADAAATKLASARKRAAEAEREAEEARAATAVLSAEVEALRGSTTSAAQVEAAKVEAATAARRAAEASAVAKDALAELDRERSSRKSRELAALKTLNEQLRTARLEAREAKDQASQVGARVDVERDARDASRAVNGALIAGARRLRAEIDQLADKMVGAAAARRDAEARARHLESQLEDALVDRQAALDRLRADLETARAADLDARDRTLRDQARQITQLLQQRRPSLDVEANNGSPKHKSSKHLAKKGRLVGLSRALFILYAIALHVLTYVSYHRCGFLKSPSPRLVAGRPQQPTSFRRRRSP